MKTRVNFRIAVIALLLGILAGAFGAGNAPRADAQTAATAAPIKAAYVDFLSIFKEEGQLKADQRRISAEAEEQLQAIDTRVAPRVEKLEAERRLWQPHQQQHLRAMNDLLKVQRDYNTERLAVESSAQTDLRNAAISSYVRLRTLIADIAKARGYNQVLNIVREPEKIAEASEDIRVLQQQLLLSPVIYYEKEHDLTDIIAAEAKKLWGVSIKVELEGAVQLDAAGTDGAEIVRLPQGDENKDRIDYKIRLGQSVRFKVKVTNNDKPAEGKQAELAWTRTGLKSGEIKDTGRYDAPAECPLQSDIVTVRVRSLVDSTSLDIRVKLLDKEGKEIDLVKLNQEKEEADKKRSEKKPGE